MADLSTRLPDAHIIVDPDDRAGMMRLRDALFPEREVAVATIADSLARHIGGMRAPVSIDTTDYDDFVALTHRVWAGVVEQRDIDPDARVRFIEAYRNPQAFVGRMVQAVQAMHDPVLVEPTEPAARVRDKYGDGWARIDGVWVSPSAVEGSMTWTQLARRRGPLRLPLPDQRETRRNR